MSITIQGTGTVFDLCEDRILYRSLEPLDLRLPRFAALKAETGLQPESHPRKSEPEYGMVCAALIRRITALEGKPEPRTLLFLGDTLFNDGSAFHNIRAAGRWDGMAFIGKDDLSQEAAVHLENKVFSANRWNLLPAFLDEIMQFNPGEDSVLVLDLDKTALGARGRNDTPINLARIAAMRQTLQSELPDGFDEDQFHQVYDTLNQPEFHAFTGDNLHYLAYLCLVILGNACSLDALLPDIRSGSLATFTEFLGKMQQQSAALTRLGLSAAHDTVWQAVQRGDPTPYKEFRKAEFLATLDRFSTDTGRDVEAVLRGNITLTAEVFQAAAWLRDQGATVLGISDKPDLSSVPDDSQAAAGILPLHRSPTLVVGTETN